MIEKNVFLNNFADQFDDTDASEIQFDTNFRELDEWSSLLSLAVLNMVGKKFDVKLKPEEMRTTNTVIELYDLINSKL